MENMNQREAQILEAITVSANRLQIVLHYNQRETRLLMQAIHMILPQDIKFSAYLEDCTVPVNQGELIAVADDVYCRVAMGFVMDIGRMSLPAKKTSDLVNVLATVGMVCYLARQIKRSNQN